MAEQQNEVDYSQVVKDAVFGDGFRRATFGGVPRSKGRTVPWARVMIRPVDIAGHRHMQFSYFDDRKDITRNFRGGEVREKLDEVLAARFAGTHISTASEEIDLHISKKGKVLMGRRKSPADQTGPAAVAPLSHNRVKDVPLPEGRADAVLAAMGVMTRDGHVRPTMRPKYTQINEFLKLLGHVAKEAFEGLDRPAEILDCGCGSSYLTIATHHYLNDVLGIPARVIGVDINEEVIRKSIEKSQRLEAQGLVFQNARIGEADVKADIVLALHACDTATDDAIAQAIRSEARVLLSVPCCHHDLNSKISAGPGDVLRPVLRHGILRERLGDLATDAFRALALRIMGYKTDVIEFVSPEHTARNLMIRAVRAPGPSERELVREWQAMKAFFGVTPYLEGVVRGLREKLESVR